MESASFSQAQPLTISNVAEDCGVNRKVVEDYFQILEDLLLSYRIPVFAKRAKRKISSHPKFFFFDVGIYRTLRPRGPLDSEEEIDGAALETLVFQELNAINDYLSAAYQISFWRTQSKLEVDFVLYGPRGFYGIEVKRTSRLRREDLDGLKAFREDYPQSKAFVIYTGDRAYHESNIEILPITQCFGKEGKLLQAIFGDIPYPR